MRQLAIGDIHGCLHALDTLLDYVALDAEDQLVLLGDYVDRGTNSRGVIDRLLELQASHRMVCLRGNHEIMMMQARKQFEVYRGWLGVGGLATLESYGAENLEAVPAAHWDFLETTCAFFETEQHFFVHANACPDLPLNEQPDLMLYWEFFNDPPPHQSGKIMICGHSAQQSGRPKNIGHAVCIDTHAHGGGWLTCLDVDSGQYWQSNEQGDRRTDAISSCLED